MRRKVLSLVLALCMVLSLMPMTAFAAPGDTFNDVDGHWGQSAIERWSEYGVVNGDGTGGFAPDKQMTRAEFATMLANMLGYKDKAANTFADVNDSDWFADAILKLAAAGVIQGSNGMANPNAPISRQEAAVMMCRAFNIPTTGGNLDFADSADVADWAKGAVAALADRGMMNGVGNNNVAPLADINRASVATLLDNMITEYVTEDKTITGEVSGIVLVAADATVTVENATLNENLIVAPKADGAEVALTGTTTASDVVVGATATVKVESTASAGTVQVAAANSTVEVAGKADAVTVDSAANNTAVNVTESAAVGDVALNAADTKVSVAENASVSNVAVSGSNANVEVSGKVDNVTVSSGATGTGITANSGATVGKVDTSANDVTVSGSGKVENVTANDGTVSVTTPGTSVENKTDSKDNVTNNGKPVEPSTGGNETPSTPGGSTGGGGNNTPATTYTITVAGSITNGSISTSVASAAEGTTVTVTGAPDATYALKTVTVTQTPAEGGEGELTGLADDPITVTPAGDNKFTFTMPASNVTVGGEFEQPLKNFKVVVVKDPTTYKQLPQAFIDWEKQNGAPSTGDGWSNLSDYPWLAVVAEPTEGYTAKTGTLAIKFTGNGDTKTVAHPWGTQVVGNHGALTAYVNTAPDYDASGNDADQLKVDNNAGVFTVTLTYQGATYTGDVTYTKPGVTTHSVTFSVDGGSAVATQTVANNEKATKPTDPTKTGYTFGGWFADVNGSAFNFDTAITADTTLTAKWTANTYTIAFDVNGGTGSVESISNVQYDASSPLTVPSGPTREGYTFKEWNTKADGTGIKLEANTKNLTAENKATVTVYAIWEKVDVPSTATFTTMSNAIVSVYSADNSSFKPGFPASGLSAFVGASLSFTPGTDSESTKITVTGTLNKITEKWTGFNGAKEEEQTGYYLPLMFAAPDGITNATQNVSIATVNGDREKSFTASAMDKDGELYYFSCFLYVDTKEKSGQIVAANTPQFTINWGEGYTATTYTLDLSGLTLKAADTGSTETTD